MMKNHILSKCVSLLTILVTLTLLVTFATSCNNTDSVGENANKIGVVVSIVTLVDFVEHIGGDKVDVSAMVPWGTEPHDYEPTMKQLREISEADMYVKVGSGVEFEIAYMDAITEANSNMLVVDSSGGVVLIGADSHTWNSPINAKIMVENICAGLIEIDQNNADFYTQNKNNYLAELDILDAYVHYKLDGFTNQTFMAYHPAFEYFAIEYGLIQLAVEHDGKEPTLNTIENSIDNAEYYDLQYVFAAPQFATAHCETIADAIGGQVVSMDPLPENYIINIKAITDVLATEFE